MATSSPYYITADMLEKRVSANLSVRIFDDDDDGTADSDIITQIIEDAESLFESYARGIYPLSSLRVVSPPRLASTLCLDIAEYLTYRRFPKAANRAWEPLMDSAMNQLKALRKGDMRLDVDGTPEPAANQGGDYYQQGYGSADEDLQPDTFTEDGFGDFG